MSLPILEVQRSRGWISHGCEGYSFFPLIEHRIGEHRELSRDRRHDDLVRLFSFAESEDEGFEGGIVIGRNQSTRKRGMPNGALNS